jgi:predicted negative regulator of RcsB-dependent stress response
VLVRALARREAELGELSSGLSRLKTERLADEILRGDLLAEAGRSHEARLAWEHALQMTETARQTPAMLQARADLSARLQSP